MLRFLLYVESRLKGGKDMEVERQCFVKRKGTRIVGVKIRQSIRGEYG